MADLTSTLSVSDGGTAWVSQESFEADETDSVAGVKWKNVARQLKEDLSSIILLSEEDLQALIDIPCAELAQELCQSCATVQGLQSTLQQVLDQREEARQSKQLLELYLQALEKEGNILSNQKGKTPTAATGEQPWAGGLVCRAAQFPEEDGPWEGRLSHALWLPAWLGTALP